MFADAKTRTKVKDFSLKRATFSDKVYLMADMRSKTEILQKTSPHLSVAPITRLNEVRRLAVVTPSPSDQSALAIPPVESQFDSPAQQQPIASKPVNMAGGSSTKPKKPKGRQIAADDAQSTGTPEVQAGAQSGESSEPPTTYILKVVLTHAPTL